MDWSDGIPGTEALGQPLMGSIYDEAGTKVSGYAEDGPYHCEDCIHKTAPDEPFCIHPCVLGDPALQNRVMLIDNRPVVKINMERGCCKYVKQALEGGSEDADQESDNGGHE
jgi:hypothetical protein